MAQGHIAKIADELRLSVKQVQAAGALLDEGATVPFLARYETGQAWLIAYSPPDSQ
ncbi:MAG: hypothetical protein O6944_10700, partial [Gammaproteobacteria bacterium]|nr:hypothetical protein [Gammaproteobacteria bacterium]